MIFINRFIHQLVLAAILMCSFSTLALAQPNYKWIKTITGPTFDEAFSLALGIDGHAHIAGTFSDSVRVDTTLMLGIGNYDGFTARFDTSGKAVDFDTYGGYSLDEVSCIVADNKGNYYVAGAFEDQAMVGGQMIEALEPFDVDMFIAKFDRSGILLWVKVFGAPGYSEPSPFIAVDSLGMVYLAGGFGKTAKFDTKQISSAGNTDIFVCKLSANGDVVWVRSAGSGQSDMALSVGVSPNGDRVYATGYFNGTVNFPVGHSLVALLNEQDFFVWALTANGETQWAKKIGTQRKDKVISGFADSEGRFLTTGAMFGKTTFDTQMLSANSDLYEDAFVCRFTKNGDIDLVRNYGGELTETGRAIYADSRGAMYVVGTFDSTAVLGGTTVTTHGGDDIFFMRLWPNGDVEWVKSAGGPYDDLGTGIRANQKGEVVVAGYFDTRATFDAQTVEGGKFTDSFVAHTKCGPNTALNTKTSSIVLCMLTDSTIQAPPGYPTYRWYVNGTIRPTPIPSKFQLAELAEGEYTVYVEITDTYNCIGFSDTLHITITPALPEPVISRQDQQLTCSIQDVYYQWFKNGKAISGAVEQSTAITGDGYYRVLISNDDGCRRWSDNFIVGPADVSADITSPVTVYPNPFTSHIVIEGAPEATIVVVDALGREVQRTTSTGNTFTMPLNGAAGTYTVIVKTGTGIQSVQVQKF